MIVKRRYNRMTRSVTKFDDKDKCPWIYTGIYYSCIKVIFYITIICNLSLMQTFLPKEILGGWSVTIHILP
jgi:hypothetical protein